MITSRTGIRATPSRLVLSSSTDATYNGLSGANVALTNVNLNTAAVDVAPTSGLQTDTNGGTAKFTVTLQQQADGQCHYSHRQQRHQPGDRFEFFADVHPSKLECRARP